MENPIIETETNDVRPLTVKEFDSEDQPREKAEKYGYQALTNAELLAIVLRTGRPGLPVTTIARNVMKSNGNKWLNLERKTDEELQEIPGIGPVKTMEIRTMLEIMRRYASENIGERPQIGTSKDIYEYMRYKIANLPYEEIWVLFLNNSNQVIDEMKVSEGGSTSSVFDLKKVLKRALLKNAEKIVLCHNHPSGILHPSGPDQIITNNLKKACSTLALTLIDHLIISTEGYYSFHDQGAM